MEQKRERLEDWAENRKKNMKDMPWKERIRWFMTYYWMQTAAVILVIVVAVYFIWFYTVGKKEVWLSGAIINVVVDQDAVDRREEAFAEAQGLNLKKQLVTLDSSYTLDADGEEYNQSDAASMTKLTTYYAVGDLDLLIAPEGIFDYMESNEYSFRDLEEILGEDFAEQFDESSIRYMQDENGNTYAGAISLAGTEFLEQIAGIGEIADREEIWIGIPYTAERAEHAAAFMEYVLGN
ncbi:MAG: hypothetical protein SOW08_05220 [Lachnospiraceae bacterium]|nr:hypothetical protein [Lachnospiraceae bacterium]